MKELRFATLMRVSTNKQSEEGRKKKQTRNGKVSARPVKDEFELPNQRSSILRFIETQPEQHKGIKWVDSGLEFIETAVSGFHVHTSKRKGLQAAYAAAKRGEFDILIVFKLDRLGRRSVESLDAAIKFLRYCRIWVVDKGIEFKNSGEQDEILNFIEFWSAKKASQDTKVRVTEMMKNIHEEGYWTGGNPPFGFDNHDTFANKLQVIPQEAEVVKKIYDLYVNHGYGHLKISGYLNERDIKSKTGRKWSAESVRRVLLNTIYKGHLSYGKTKMVEGEFGSYQKALKIGEGTISEKYWQEYDIIGADIWNKAQEIRESRLRPNMFGGKRPTKQATGKGLLVGLLRCECGGHMTYSSTSDWTDSTRTKKKEPYGVYRCQTRIKQGVAACGAKRATYRVKEADAKVLAELEKFTTHLLTDNQLEKIRAKTEAATENVKEKIESVKEDIERYTAAKNNANAELMKIFANLPSDISKNQASQIFEMAEKELEKLEKQLAEYESLKATDNMNDMDLMKLETFISNWIEIFNFGTPHQKRKLLAALVEDIQVIEGKYKIKAALDIPKLFESISSIKETAADEIAASLAGQGAEAAASYLQTVSGGCSDGGYNTGMLYKKLSKAFGEKLKEKIIVA